MSTEAIFIIFFLIVFLSMPILLLAGFGLMYYDHYWLIPALKGKIHYEIKINTFVFFYGFIMDVWTDLLLIVTTLSFFIVLLINVIPFIFFFVFLSLITLLLFGITLHLSYTTFLSFKNYLYDKDTIIIIDKINNTMLYQSKRDHFLCNLSDILQIVNISNKNPKDNFLDFFVLKTKEKSIIVSNLMYGRSLIDILNEVPKTTIKLAYPTLQKTIKMINDI